jgi:hypothetical protein
MNYDTDSKIYVAPLDSESRTVIEAFAYTHKQVVIITEKTIQDKISFYRTSGRSFAESIFSVKPLVIQFALKLMESDDILLYCDSDIFFYQRMPDALFENSDVIIFEHIFAKRNLDNLKYGKYNAGMIGFRNSIEGNNILNWWLNKCEKYCFTILHPDSFSDQKYLESFALLSRKVKVISEKTINQSLWVLELDSKVTFGPSLDGDKLIAFHFHGTKPYQNVVYLDLFRYGKHPLTDPLLEFIYQPYLKAMQGYLHLVFSSLEVRNISFKDRMFQTNNYATWL